MEWNEVSLKWFLPKYFKQSAIIKSLKKISTSNSIENGDVVPVLGKIIAFNKEQKLIEKHTDFLIPLLGFMWQGGDCDWQSILLISNTIIHINREIISLTGSTIKAKLWRDNIANDLSEGSKNFFSIQGKSIHEFTDAHLLINSLQKELVDILQFNFEKLQPVSESYLDDLETAVSQSYASIEQLKDWVIWLSAKETAINAGLLPVVLAYESGKIKSTDVVNAFKKGLYRSCAEYIIQKEPSLSLFNGKLFEEKIRRFREMSQYFEQLTKDELYAKLASKIPDFTREASQSSEIGILQKTIGNSGRAMPIRKLFNLIPNLLPRITPCILMSPISVAQYFDAGGAKFDLVIFDEASQMPTCEAVGAIARADNMIVVGDPKQMPPTSFFSSSTIDEDNIENEDLESILDDCLALSIPSKHLLWHYRSKHESLIAFSNSKYYENKLLTFPSPDDITSKVNYIHVPGYYDRGKTRQNAFEAKAVIDEIKRRLSDPALSKRSIGVVTFSSVQQILIQNMFDELLRTHPHLERIAVENTEPIFIKNLENVQGDERDVILFSVGYGPDKEGKVSLNFGPLNREGGWRRLNVAVSRARYEMKVYSTLRADQIDITRSASEGVAGIKSFLEYAEKGRSTLSTTRTEIEFVESGFEKLMAAEIRKHGYDVHTNIGCSGYRIDIGIVNKEKPSEYILGILCDGNNYYAAKAAKDREIIQHEVLRLLGWTLHKIWSTDWWENAERVMDNVLEAIRNAELKKDLVEEYPQQEGINHESQVASMVFNNNFQGQIIPVIDEVSLKAEYKICNLEIVLSTSSDDFLQNRNFQKIKDQINAVVETEAPIMRSLLARRILAAWGISKLGIRINAQFEQLLNEVNLDKTGSDGNNVFWSKNLKADDYNSYRVSTTSVQKRDAEDLPPEEIANAIKETLSYQISLPFDELVREMSRIFGFARSGTNVELAMKRGISKALANDYVLERDGRIIFKDTTLK